MLCIGGRKSRNKVIVGEPAIGSLLLMKSISFSFENDVNKSYISMIGSGDTSAQLAMKDESYLVILNEL